MYRMVFAGLALATLAFVADSSVAATVSCEGFALGYNGQAKKVTCAVDNASTGDMDAEAKVLTVHGQGFVMSVTYEQAGFRTYLPFRSVDRLLRQSSFMEV